MSEKPRIKRLIWDIETSPNVGLFWAASRKQFIPYDNIVHERAIICICYKWEGHDTVYSMTWDDGDDYEMLRKFQEIAITADELVAHNGDKFDLKWFNGRCLIHDLPPFSGYKTVDTLQIANRRFNLNSKRLDYLAKILGVNDGQGKLETDFEMWKNITLKGNSPEGKADLKRMVDYCKEDVRLLEKVWQRMEGWHKPKSHVGVLNGEEKWTCPYTGSKAVQSRGKEVTTAGTIKWRMQNRETGRWYTISDKAHRDYQAWRIDQELKSNERYKEENNEN